jgi:hypothetical protein
MERRGAIASVLTLAAAIGGCAGAPAGGPSLAAEQPLAHDTANDGYQLSDQEKKYGCKKLTGIMQVRILQIRDYDPDKKATMVARGLQSVATPIFGGTTTGINPDAQYRKERAMLEAYNARLAEKKCKTYDLDAALRSRGLNDMPRPGEDAKKPGNKKPGR